ncbi:DUF58 domain-containing protein [Flammeovirgaceae bacterium SG7u.111]|nr:DUF58 domain-containing protein [Flammeovirgaceae bacterium SG7u.132]WPO36266.1 DUF58 domain-containing protein [Flammeovirgaceae bacterium SG7u.111]
MHYPPQVVASLPELMKLEYLVSRAGLMPKKPVYSVLAGPYASKLRGRGLDFEEARLYVNGDDIRNIDWKVTARTKKTHTKVFNEEKERPNFTIVDQSSSMFFGSVEFTKSVIAAQLASLSGFKALSKGDRFGGMIISDDTTELVNPKRNRKSVLRFLQLMVEANEKAAQREKIHAEGNTLNKALFQAIKSISHDNVIIVISDFSSADEKTVQHLIKLDQHNDVIVAVINDPMEEAIPDNPFLFSDGDKQVLWKKGKQKSHETFREQFEDHISFFKKKLTTYKIPVVSLDTLSSANEQLKTVFSTFANRHK